MNEFLFLTVCSQMHLLMQPVERVAPVLLACDPSSMLEKMGIASNTIEVITAIADFPLVDPPRLFLS